MNKQTILQTKNPGQLRQHIRLLWLAIWLLSMTTLPVMAQFTGYGNGSDGELTLIGSTTTFR